MANGDSDDPSVPPAPPAPTDTDVANIEAVVEASKEGLKVRREELEVLKEIARRHKENIDLSDEQNTRLISIYEAEKTLQQVLDEQQKLAKGINFEKLKELETEQNLLDGYKQGGRAAKLKKEIAESEKKIQELQLGVLKDQLTSLDNQLAAGETVDEKGQDLVETQKEVQAAIDKITKALEDQADLQDQIKDGEEAINKIKAKGLSILTSVYTKTLGVATAAFDAQKQFERTFQMPQEYTDQLGELHKDLAITGVSMKDLTEGTGELINSVTDFTMASEGQRKALQDTTARLSKLGIAASDTAKGVQNSMKLFGQSITEAEQTSRELVSVANELGVAPKQMAAEYASMGTQLAKFGTEGTKTFKELARIQKLTGMEMSKVVQIASKFDTFEDAATATGKLNAALGGNFVNAMDMMMDTDPVSRFDTIRGAIEDAGLSFDTMSYYQKQFYTEALGLSDVGDLALMMSGRTDLMTDATQASAASQIELAERQQKVMNISEQWNAMIAKNSDKIIELMHTVQGFIAGLMEYAWLIKGLIMIYAAYNAVLATNAVVTAAIGLKVKWTAAQLLIQEGATISSAIAQAFFGASSTVASGGAKLFTRALLPLVAGLAAFALVMMIASPSLLVIELVAFGAALYLLGTILPGVSPGLTTAGLAMMVFGAGLFTVLGPIALVVASVALLAAGIGFMAAGFAKMFAAVEIPKLVALGKFFVSMGAGVGFIIAGAIGMGLFAASMVAFGISLAFVSGKKLASLATIMESMALLQGEGLKDSATGLKGITAAVADVKNIKAVEGMAEAFDRLGESVAGVVTPMEVLVAAMGSLTEPQWNAPAQSFSTISTSINELPLLKTTLVTAALGEAAIAAVALAPMVAAFGGGAAAIGAGTAAIGSAFGGNTGGGNTGGGNTGGGGARTEPIQIVVEIDGDIFKKKVEKVMGEYHKEG